MPSGLVALLDDVAAITKLAAASLDDISATAGKAGTKAAGVVVDDTAVTPRYVTGFTPDRELPIIWAIAKGSLRNKLLILLPLAIALSALAPWAIVPLLMIGGTYLCFEGTEKVIEWVAHHDEHDEAAELIADLIEHERTMVSGAIRTDFILSAEIMAIALADVAARSLQMQAVVLAVVAILITIGVYGVVALIVKMDDIGLHLAGRRSSASRVVGRGLVLGMPILMNALSTIGTLAMIWVGGGIVLHGLEEFHLTPLPHYIHAFADAVGHGAPFAGGAVTWLLAAFGAGLVGLVVGGLVVVAVHATRNARRSARVDAVADELRPGQ
jgi:predicted DNA repair protein MutK